jgi:3,4-dihydroxy 2-butanone 4-phosphate synthase/GTP cyclohydrolase II
MLQTYLATLAIHWQGGPLSLESRYQKLKDVRQLAQSQGLVVQEEARPMGAALFGQPHLILHLGLDGATPLEETWYAQPPSPHRRAVLAVLDELVGWSEIDQLAFFIAVGHDPFSGLQVGLSRQVFPRPLPPRADQVKPSALADQLTTQRVYLFSSSPR